MLNFPPHSEPALHESRVRRKFEQAVALTPDNFKVKIRQTILHVSLMLIGMAVS